MAPTPIDPPAFDLTSSSRPAGAAHRLALSPSRAADFRQCPLKYRYRAIDRIPETPSRAAVLGTVVHAALEALFALPAAQRVLGRAAELVAPAWERVLRENPDAAQVVVDDTDTFLTDAETLVSSYYALEDPTRFDAQACEARVEVQLRDGVLLRGFVDRLDRAPDGALRVVDYKTGRAPGPLHEQAALFQMKFYALMILRTSGVVPRQLKLLYLAPRKALVYEPDSDELSRFERTLSAMWKAIRKAGETGDFRAKPGPLCNWCDFRSLCPEFGGAPPPYPARSSDLFGESAEHAPDDHEIRSEPFRGSLSPSSEVTRST